MKRLATLAALSVAMLLMTTGAASAGGDPRGPHGWLCVLDLGAWHCVSPGVEKNLGGPTAPSVNFVCDDPYDPVCAGNAVRVGPPEGTHFAGTENLIRADLYAGQPCPRGTSGLVELPFGTYYYCHHYGG